MNGACANPKHTNKENKEFKWIIKVVVLSKYFSDSLDGTNVFYFLILFFFLDFVFQKGLFNNNFEWGGLRVRVYMLPLYITY